MAGTLLLPDLRRILGGLERRLAILERRTRDETATGRETEIIFSYSGALSTTTSPKAYLRDTTRLVNVLCSLGTAGTSTTSVQIKKNGTTIGTISLGSGETLERVRFAEGWVADTDAMTVTISAAGTGAANLTVQARFG